MSELYQAIFTGKVVGEADPADVRRQLEDLGVLKGGLANDAFAGKPVVLRAGLTREQADRFAGALETAHAHCQVVPESWRLCPSCHFAQEAGGEECLRCGLIFAKHHEDAPRKRGEIRTRAEIARDLKSAGYKKFSNEPGPAEV